MPVNQGQIQVNTQNALGADSNTRQRKTEAQPYNGLNISIAGKPEKGNGVKSHRLSWDPHE